MEEKRQTINLGFMLESYINNRGDLLTFHDIEGNNLYISPSCLRLLGHAPEDLTGRSFFDIVHPFDLMNLKDKFSSITKHKPWTDVEFRLKKKDGSDLWLEGNFSSFEENGRNVIAGVSRDISRRKRQEEILKSSEERLRLLAENTDDMIYIYDLDFRIIYYNGGGRLNVNREEFLGKKTGDILDHGKAMQLEQQLRQVAESGRRMIAENWIAWRDHEYCFMEEIFPVKDSHGQITSIAKISRDITARKEVEETSKLSQFTIDNIGEAVYWIDREGRVVYANNQACRLLGYTQEEMLKLRVPDFARDFPMHNWDNHWSEIEELGTKVVEVSHARKDGTTILVEVTVNHLVFRGREFHCDFIRDIGEKKKAAESLQRSEALLRSMFKAAPIGIGIVRNRVIEGTNDYFCRMLGYSQEEVMGKSTRIVYEDDAEYDRIGQIQKQDANKYGIDSVVSRFVRKDGRPVDVILSASLIDPDDPDKGLVYAILDITDRVNAEKELVRANRRNRALLSGIPDSLLVLSKDGTCIDYYLHDQIKKPFGAPDNCLGECLGNLKLSTESHNKSMDCIKQAIETGDIQNYEDTIETAEGRLYFEFRFSKLNENEVLLIIGDITLRHKAEDELQRSEDLLDQAIIGSGGGVWKLEFKNFEEGDKVPDEIYLSPVLKGFIGYSDDEFPNKLSAWRERVLEEDRETLLEASRAHYLGKTEYYAAEYRIRHKDGSIRWMLTRGKIHRDTEGRPQHWIGIDWDISEHKLAHEALRESREIFRALTENSTDLIIRFDRDCRFLYVNPVIEEYSGKSPSFFIGHTPRELAIDERLISLIEANIGRIYESRKPMRGQHEYDLENRKIAIDWRLIPEFTDDGDVGTVMATCRDISEMRKLQEFTTRAMRLETAGRIAGQVAHDFNNLLGPLMAYPELIRDELPPDHAVQPMLEDMKRATEQIVEINQQLLTLGRRGHYTLSVLNLNDIVRQALNRIFPVPETLVIEKELSTELMNIRGGGSQILRAVSNLIGNARDAMQDIGTLIIKTENAYIDKLIGKFGRIPKGEYVRLSVIDTGCGIDPDILPKIFDPFFTTKTASGTRGSGLGLSVVHAVMEDHNGYVDYDSVQCEGTSIHLYFPISREDLSVLPSSKIAGGTEKILIVDDDQTQRDVSQKLLEKLGYRIEVVENGEKALREMKRNNYDLLILDMVMPGGIDGLETYQRALHINPDQKVLIVSGYSESEKVACALELGAGGFLRKPLTLKSIANAVREVLDKIPVQS